MIKEVTQIDTHTIHIYKKTSKRKRKNFFFENLH